MRHLIVIASTFLIFLTYFTQWQDYDSTFSLLALLSGSWFVVIWAGYYLFKNKTYYWPVIGAAVYFLVIYKSAAIVAEKLMLYGIPTDYSDDQFYIDVANRIAQSLAGGDIASAIISGGLSYPGYLWLLGLLYFIGDIYQDTQQVLAAVTVNALALTLTILGIFRYALDIVQTRWKMLFWTCVVFAAQNSILSLASVVRKDILILFFVTEIYLIYNHYRLTFEKKDLFLVTLFLIALSLFRLPIVAVAMLLIIFDIVFNRSDVKPSALIPRLTLLLVVSLALAVGYFSNINFMRADSPLQFENTEYLFYADIGITRVIYDLPLIGPALWYFLGPLISVFMFSISSFTAAFSSYPLGVGLIFFVTERLFIMAVYYALFKSLLSSGRRSRQCKQLAILMMIFSAVLQLGGAGSEARHFSMVYPFMLLLCLLYFPPRLKSSSGYRRELTQDKSHGKFCPIKRSHLST